MAAEACAEYVFSKEIFKTSRLFLVTTKVCNELLLDFALII